PFKGYGQILIIQHGDAYHTLLAGMRRVDATLGQRLLSGEPIGVMGIQDAGSRLYIEVRRKGQPINPLPWFTAANSKVRG
ncbi:MAG: murein hydrolase activator EnvC family protein, partial [Rhodospirillales bacterium]